MFHLVFDQKQESKNDDDNDEIKFKIPKDGNYKLDLSKREYEKLSEEQKWSTTFDEEIDSVCMHEVKIFLFLFFCSRI